MESVRHHVEEEEHEMFPRVRKKLSRAQLLELGDLIERAKKVAPTRPHPKAPDEPPANAVAALAVGLVDRVRDAASTATSRAASNGRRRVAASRTTARHPRKTTRKASTTRSRTSTRPSGTRKAAARKRTTRTT
jgi:hypothetical protein